MYLHVHVSPVLQEGLFIGAAVTQASLIDYLLEASSAANKKNGHETNGDNGHLEKPQGGMPSVYTALAHHLQRIAGNPVSTAVHWVVSPAAVYAACVTSIAAYALHGRTVSGCNVPVGWIESLQPANGVCLYAFVHLARCIIKRNCNQRAHLHTYCVVTYLA